DVVSDRNFVGNLPASQLPFGDCALDEQARVSVPLIVELRMQRAESDVDLNVAHRFVLHYGNTILMGGEILVGDRRLELLDVEGRCHRLQLAAADKPLSVRTDIDAMWTLRARHQIHDARGIARIDYFYSGNHLHVAGSDGLLSGLPVHRRDVIAIPLRRGDL